MPKLPLRINNANPKNYRLIILNALECRNYIQANGYMLKGVSARYTRKKKWETQPKISLVGSDGDTKNSKLEKPNTPTRSKSMIATLYALCHIEKKLKSCHVFYSDKKGGQEQGISSKHGPEKSDYMRGLITELNKPGLIEELEDSLMTSLPEGLTSLQKAILSVELEDGSLSTATIHDLKKKFKCDSIAIDDALRELSKTKGLGKRIIPLVNWGKIDSIVYKREIGELNALLLSKQTEIDSMTDCIEQLKQAKSMIDALMRRTLFQRIFNKKPVNHDLN